MDPSVIGEVFVKYGWPGLICLIAGGVLLICINKWMKKGTKENISALNEGFTNLTNSISNQNSILVDAIVQQNRTNTELMLSVIDTALKRHDKQCQRDYDKNLEIRKEVSIRIKTKMHDLLNRYNADRAFILEFHNSKQNMTGLSFLWFDMTFEEIAKGVHSIQSFWKDQEASQLLPVVNDVTDNDGFKIYSIDELEQLQKSSTVLYHRLRIERQLQEAIMVGLYGIDNTLIGLLILEYEYDFIPVEVLDREDIVATAASIAELLDYNTTKDNDTMVKK